MAQDSVMAVVGAMQTSHASREAAANILHKLADAGSYGSFPEDVTCEDIGRALERICINCHEEDPMLKVFEAWRSAERDRDRKLRS